MKATEFQKVMATGATRPAVFRCEEEDGTDAGEFVVKFRSEVTGNVTGLCFECIAARLASYFSIPSPEPALVELSDELAAAVPTAPVRQAITDSVGWNFATEYRPQSTPWMPTRRVTPGQVNAAGAIIAFDFVIDNIDRRGDGIGKPNLLVINGEMHVLDHEKTFSFTSDILGREGYSPFGPNQIAVVGDSHALKHGLAGQTPDLAPFVRQLKALDDMTITGICDSASAIFESAHADGIPGWLAECRSRATRLPPAVLGLLR